MLSALTSRWNGLLPDPFEVMRRDLDGSFEGFPGDGFQPIQKFHRYAPLSVWEDAERVYVELDVPGLGHEDLDVRMEKGRLIVRGERKSVRQISKCWHDDRYFGTFERVVQLAEGVDPSQIEAKLAHGVLTITLPKKPEAQARRIAVKPVEGEAGEAKRIESQQP